MKKSHIILGLSSLLLLEPAAEIAALALKKPAQELPDDKDFDYYSANVNGKRFEDLYLFLAGEKDAFVDPEAWPAFLKKTRAEFEKYYLEDPSV